jgi:hypothetical protein
VIAFQVNPENAIGRLPVAKTGRADFAAAALAIENDGKTYAGFHAVTQLDLLACDLHPCPSSRRKCKKESEIMQLFRHGLALREGRRNYSF